MAKCTNLTANCKIMYVVVALFIIVIMAWIILQIGKRSDKNCPQMTKQGTENFARRSF